MDGLYDGELRWMCSRCGNVLYNVVSNAHDFIHFKKFIDLARKIMYICRIFFFRIVYIQKEK